MLLDISHLCLNDDASILLQNKKAYLDDDKTNVVLITGFLFRRGEQVQVECVWFHNGTAMKDWFPAWRLTLVEEDG